MHCKINPPLESASNLNFVRLVCERHDRRSGRLVTREAPEYTVRVLQLIKPPQDAFFFFFFHVTLISNAPCKLQRWLGEWTGRPAMRPIGNAGHIWHFKDFFKCTLYFIANECVSVLACEAIGVFDRINTI